MQLLQPYGLKFAYDLFLYQMNSEAADLLFQVDSLQVALGISLSGLLVELNAQNGAQVVDSSLDVVGLNSDVTVLPEQSLRIRSCCQP